MQPETSRFPGRLSKVREHLLTDRCEALLILDLNNIRYLTGFTGGSGALLLDDGRSILLVDGRYITQAREEAPQVEIFECRDKMEGIAEILATFGAKTVGFESAAISFESYGKLKEKIHDVRLESIPNDGSGIRAIKDESEVALLREAAAKASETLTSMLNAIRPGVMERDVALELEYMMRRSGAGGVSFPTIVASGVNSALPHATPGARKLAKGDVVVIDFGTVYGGYHSDETCTFVLGVASSRQKEVYSVVKEAHDRAVAAVKAGIPCCEIDRIARDCMNEGGLEPFFSHAAGHGIGLDIHEPPKMSASSKAVLEAGMVITIEPGVYIPGLWGVRIEDMVLVKKDGCEVLTKMGKDLTLLN